MTHHEVFPGRTATDCVDVIIDLVRRCAETPEGQLMTMAQVPVRILVCGIVGANSCFVDRSECDCTFFSLN